MRRLFGVFSPGRLLLVATLIASGYFLFSAGTNFMHSYRLASDEARQQAEVDELQLQKEQLEQVRDYLRTDEYVEFMARRVFGLVKPGESLVVVQAPAPEQMAESPDLTWWQRLFSR